MDKTLLVVLVLASASLFLGSTGAEAASEATIAGRITDQDGQPVADAYVSVYQCCMIEPDSADSSDPAQGSEPGSSSPGKPAHAMEASTDADGRFRITVLEGEASIYASKEGYAAASDYVTVAPGEVLDLALTMTKYPAKTARVEGSVVDENGAPVLDFSVNVQSPAFGLNECSNRDAPLPADGQEGSVGGGADGSSGASGVASSIIAPDWYGCTIRIDGNTFSGLVTPGYSIVTVSFDHWRTCADTRLADGSLTSSCGRDRYPSIQSLVLPADGTSTLAIVLKAKPGPDAVLQGYVLDEAGAAIPGARLEVSHLDTWAWGTGAADKDGSFRLRVLSGPQHVRTYADGFLHWEGIVDVAPGTHDLVVRLVAGNESGYCCYAVRDGVMPPMAAGQGEADGTASADDQEQAVAYEDLGGGLGPYQEPAGKDTPLPLVALVAVIVAVGSRRRA